MSIGTPHLRPPGLNKGCQSSTSCTGTYENVAAAVKLAIDVDLWKGGPLAVLLHAAAQALIL